MIWQDLIFTLGGFAFAALLLPTLLYADSSVPRTTSLPTAAILLVYSLTFITMGLLYSAFANALTASAWLAIAIWRAP